MVVLVVSEFHVLVREVVIVLVVSEFQLLVSFSF